MLDTNTVSYLARRQSANAAQRFEEAVDAGAVCLSVVTVAEILYGLARRPEATRRAHMVELFLQNMRVLPWMSSTSLAYAALRAENERRGIAVGNLDMLIAAHALAENAVLVTSDGAIGKLVGGPETVNWADDLRTN